MPHWSVPGLVIAFVLVPVSLAPLAQTAAGLSVPDAVARYARGDFETGVRDLDTSALKVAPFTRALDEWIADGDPETRPRRRIVAAAFALDATWAATRTEANAHWLGDGSGRNPPISPERETLVSLYAQPLVARWAIQQLPAAGAPDPLQRLLWLTTVGIVEDGHAWGLLQREILPLARKHLPDEPRLSLAAVLARTNLDLGLLQTSHRRRLVDVLRAEPLLGGAGGRIPGAIRAFEPLLADATLAGEVELRIGYLELRRKRWPAALARFDAARSKASEPLLRAAANYFSGWAFEQQDHRDEAITAYKRALEITPTMRNLATRLSALLYLRNERSDAYATLDRALNARPAPMDFIITLWRADARFVPEWIREIRKALK